MKTYMSYVGASVAVLVVTIMANGSAITYVTPNGSTDAASEAVSAQADFTTGNGTVTILLQNLQVNPISVGQALSDLFFTIDTGQTSGTLIHSSGMERTIAVGGSFTDGGTVGTGWSLSTSIVDSNTGLLLDVLGTAIAPAHTIIGPPDGSNVYSNANSSIAGNGSNNPFLALSASFTLSVPGVTADSIVNSAVFSFGTTEGDYVTGYPGNDVPEPATLTLLALGGLVLLRRR